MSKLKLKDIILEAASHGWKVLSNKYKNLDTEMEFECPQGHQVFLPWKQIRDKYECPICFTSEREMHENTAEVIPKPANTYRILALDQASHKTGYAIFDNDKLIHYGVFSTNAHDEIQRFSAIKSWLLSIISSWHPDFIGLEGIQFQEQSGGARMGITVFQTLARLQGILMETCYEAKIPYEVCPTNTWRMACRLTGRSRIDKKRSMQLLVQQWYNVTATDDESDAIGIGHYLTTKVAKIFNVENWEN